VIELSEFPILLKRFRKRVPQTERIERKAAQLIGAEFDKKALKDFVGAVRLWGGYAGIAARVINNNQHSSLSRLFRKAHAKASSGMVCQGLETLLNAKELGVSFASKHLKFLVPESAVVLDSVICQNLGYAKTPAGYQDFLDDCHAILERITTDKVKYTGWSASGWRVCDVETAIYEKLKFG
jgi:hypothetical protein